MVQSCVLQTQEMQRSEDVWLLPGTAAQKERSHAGDRDAPSAREAAWAELGLSQERTINFFYSLQRLEVC